LISNHDVGSSCALEVHEVAGEHAGPTIAVLGGVHGDELEGVTAARMLLDSLHRLEPAELHGRLRVVPIANPPAFAAGKRSSPVDGLNLARRFPGSSAGSVTDRIADVLTTQVIDRADLLIDLHSAGADYEMPVFAGFVADGPTAANSEAAARAFSAPVLWIHDRSNPGRSISVASALGVPSIYVEGSGGGGLRGADMDVYIGGLWRVMAAFGMVAGMSEQWQRPTDETVVLRGGDGDVDTSVTTPVAGFCVTRAQPGQVVAEGDRIAEIVDSHGAVAHVVRAPRAATVMMLRRRASVDTGDAIAMLGPVPEEPMVSAKLSLQRRSFGDR
jgi:predicted deacylase